MSFCCIVFDFYSPKSEDKYFAEDCGERNVNEISPELSAVCLLAYLRGQGAGGSVQNGHRFVVVKHLFQVVTTEIAECGLLITVIESQSREFYGALQQVVKSCFAHLRVEEDSGLVANTFLSRNELRRAFLRLQCQHVIGRGQFVADCLLVMPLRV